MSRRTLLVASLGMAAAVAAGLSGLRAVAPGESMVVRRLGRAIRPAWGPGLHLGWPLGLDRFDRVRTDEVRRLAIGRDRPGEASDGGGDAGEFLTGDLNLARVQATVQYRVEDPVDFVVWAGMDPSVLANLAEARLTAKLAGRRIDDVLRGERQRLAQELGDELRARSRERGLGLAILGVSLMDARPPAEVAGDFAAAQSAESLRDGRIRAARTRAETTVTEAKAEAVARLDRAKASSDRRAASSRAEAGRFLAILEEARRSRGPTVGRLYLDAMRTLLGRVRRKVVVPAGDAVDLTVLGDSP